MSAARPFRSISGAGMQDPPGIFEPFEINGVAFRSRVLRSSLGGRMAFYDGTVAPVWKNFERRFADPALHLGGIISATIDIDDKRLSPLEYPKLSHDRFIKPLAEGVKAVQAQGCPVPPKEFRCFES